MPVYEYRCEKCGHLFERTESMAQHEKAHPRCPECRSPRVQRVFGAFSPKTSRKS